MIKEVNNSYYKPPQDICSFKFLWVKIDKVLMTKFFPFNMIPVVLFLKGMCIFAKNHEKKKWWKRSLGTDYRSINRRAVM